MDYGAGFAEGPNGDSTEYPILSQLFQIIPGRRRTTQTREARFKGKQPGNQLVTIAKLKFGNSAYMNASVPVEESACD